MRNIYNINLIRTALLLSLVILRNKTFVAFVKSFILPLDLLNEDFSTYRNAIDMSVNSQICYMRGMLNDYYDYYERRIKIRTRPLNRNDYLLWKRQNDKPIMIGRSESENRRFYSISKRGQIGVREPDFEVVLPSGYALSENERNQLIAIVNQHKLASKFFIITNG